MKPSIPNQNKAYNALYSRLVNYMAQVQSIYDRIASQVAIAVDGVDYDGSAEFQFQNYPELSQTINGLMSSYAAQMNNLIYAGTTNEWKESNTMQDLLARKVLRAYDFEKGGDKYNRYFQPNSEALKAFQERTDRGMNLSQKLWAQSQGLKKELEDTISTAIDKGQSAVVLSKRISQYLNDFPSLKKDYGEKFGKAISSRDCQYASIRLARTEINMAYRKAEQLRWQQFDFILGYEVKLSKRHPAPDICDDLKGKYPKDFVFLGWHPNCMCYVVPIVMSDDEYYGSENLKEQRLIKDVPSNYKNYMILNQDRINNLKAVPYFIKDNPQYNQFAKEYVFNSDEASYLKQVNFNKIDVDKYNTSVMKRFNIRKFDKELEELFDKNEIYIDTKRLTIFPNGNTSLVYEGVSPKGEEFYMKRSFRKDESNQMYVYHDTLYVPLEIQGKGFAKKLLATSYKHYKESSIKYITLKANIDVGGYAWARYGFSTDIEDVMAAINHHEGLQSLKNKAIDVFEKWKKSHKNAKLFPMNEIAKQDYGKKLLLGSHWNGMLDLTDKDMVNVFENYIGITH